MCRLLLVKSDQPFESQYHLNQLAQIARNSQEYQGHGWGCACLINGRWEVYKNIKPIWEDQLAAFPPTTLLLAHARSAFRNEGIAVENNMPFFDEKYVFIFNGELQGVKIKAEGRIGAEKIFNYIKRFDTGDFAEAVRKAVNIIQKRTTYLRAMNILISDRRKIYLVSVFNEAPEYFTLHLKRHTGQLIICSENYRGESNWQKIKNHTIEVFA